MTVALILPDRIVSDSKLSVGRAHTVGKIFRRPDGALFITAGDSRLTYSFESAMMEGRSPEPMDIKEDESFEGVVLLLTGRIVIYDVCFSPFHIGESWTAIGSGGAVADSWYRHNHAPEICIERAIEVHDDCGGPVVTVMLHQEPASKRRNKLALATELR